MVATYPVLSLLVIFALSLLVVRIGSVALQLTGHTRTPARDIERVLAEQERLVEE